MKSKTQLSVRPMRKSKKPGYPSWQEPNPLEQPYALPYPFTQKAINWLAASGLCGALFLMPDDVFSQTTKDTHLAIEADTLKNPFPFHRASPVHRPFGYGTGLPRYLNMEEVKSIFEKVMESEGFVLNETVLKAGGGSVKMDGYDNDAKIGYLWLGGVRINPGVRMNSTYYNFNSFNIEKISSMRVAEKRVDEFGRSISKMYELFTNHRFKNQAVKNIIPKLKSLIDNGAPDWQEDYKYMVYEYLIDERLVWYHDNEYGSAHFKEYLRNVLAMNSGEEKNNALDNAMNIIPVFILEEDWMADAFMMGLRSTESTACLERLYFLQKSYLYISPRFTERGEKIRALIEAGKDNWKLAIPIVQQWIDEMVISPEESNSLANDVDKGKNSIAFIYPQDNRFGYYTTEASIAAQTKREVEQYMRNNPNADPYDYEKAISQSYHGVTREEVMRKLEKEVLQYLQWAKHQRGY